MSEGVDRRRFLRGAGLAAAGALTVAGCGRKLTDSELSTRPASRPSPAPWWTIPGRGPGEHTLLELPYGKDKLVINDPANPKIKGISAQVVEWQHDKHHAGYVKSLNDIEKHLAAMQTIEAKANYSPFSELKRRETFNASGMYLHDIYWLNLTPGGSQLAATTELYQRLVLDFGSLDRWREDFIGTAQTANTGWAILCLAPYDLKLHNFACSFHDLGGVWGALPLIALDVWEHAYYFDYGPDRGSYIESFLRLLNWPQINDNFRRLAPTGATPR